MRHLIVSTVFYNVRVYNNSINTSINPPATINHSFFVFVFVFVGKLFYSVHLMRDIRSQIKEEEIERENLE